MTDDHSGFWTEAWAQLRPDMLSGVVEFGQYLRLWAVVLGAHLVRLIMATAGIEPEITKPVALMERWVFIASFASFFWRVLLRLYHSTKRPLR